jgi:hypothetical protein
MKKEKLPITKSTPEVRTLSAQTKVRYLLDIFKLANDDKVEQRKENFIKLLGEYKRATVETRVRNQSDVISSDSNKAEIHNKIMEIIRNLSLSVGLSEKQRSLTVFLANDRTEVGKMIDSYFSGDRSNGGRVMSPVQQARLGIGPYSSSSEDDF